VEITTDPAKRDEIGRKHTPGTCSSPDSHTESPGATVSASSAIGSAHAPARTPARPAKPFTPPVSTPYPASVTSAILRGLFFLATLYVFFVSIDLMSTAFKLMGTGFATQLLRTSSDPLAGLLIGLLVTSLVQSSSFTTSMVVGLVAAGTIPLRMAIPILMGANIGTTVTNTIVSLGHVTRRQEFERAFAAGTVHDFFNVLAVLVLFPLERLFHPIETVALAMERAFAGAGGVQMVSPLNVIVKPVTHGISEILPYGIPLLLIALVLLFISLAQMVRLMRRVIMTRVEKLFDRVLFRNDASGFALGWLLTSLVQSSSATTSLIVPLVGSGVLTVRRIYAYTLGANLGTTVTAILASFATGNPVAITVAFAHMVFNIFGILIFYPLRSVPIHLATALGRIAARSRKNVVVVLTIYVVAHIIPLTYILLRQVSGR